MIAKGKLFHYVLGPAEGPVVVSSSSQSLRLGRIWFEFELLPWPALFSKYLSCVSQVSAPNFLLFTTQ